jgi:hypothetical protein
MKSHYIRKDKRRRYALAEDENGKLSRIYLKKCKVCKVYKIPAVAKRDLCFRCEREK